MYMYIYIYIYLYIYIYIYKSIVTANKKLVFLFHPNSHIIFDEKTKFFPNIFPNLKSIIIIQLIHSFVSGVLD